jgi:hypothetical protein
MGVQHLVDVRMLDDICVSISIISSPERAHLAPGLRRALLSTLAPSSRAPARRARAARVGRFSIQATTPSSGDPRIGAI